MSMFASILALGTVTPSPAAAQGNDVMCDGLVATIVGTAGADVLTGTDGPDVIAALEGNDVIRGQGGDDVICAGRGHDVVYGGPGLDVMFGARGDDTLFFADGRNASARADTAGGSAFGGPGNDEIIGSSQRDQMLGGLGADTLLGFEGNDLIRAGRGKDLVDGGPGIDDLHGRKGNDTIIIEGNDSVRGGGGTNDRCIIEPGSSPSPLVSCEIIESDPETVGELPAVDGPLSAPHPTIENISLLWDTVGNANANATVTVRYRQLGTSVWLPALPLRNVSAGSNEGFSWGARHAGSIFDLNPGTEYEVQATFIDPDGPNDVRSISVRTRSVPAAMAGAPVKQATPSTLNSVLNSAQPGDIVLLSAGNYSEFEVNRSGTPGRPIVIRGLPGAVVTRELNIFGQSDVHVENLTVNGRIRFNGSDRIAITGNTINARSDRGGDGIVTFVRSEDSYIADNTVNGLTVWRESSLGAQGDNLGEGILVTGPGHVIEHNEVTGMRDGISFMEDNEADDQFSIDVIRNDIRQAADDGIEADFCMHNCRMIENQLTNTFVAFSSQPSLGGPNYFVRNTAYNVGHVAFKLYRGSQGDVLLHNTVVKGGDALGIYSGRDVTDLYMRNNLLIGGPGDTYNGFSNGSGQVMRIADLDESSADMNFNGYGSQTNTFTGQFASVSFASVAQMRSRTTETNSVQVNLSSFAAPVSYPDDGTNQYNPVDLRLADSSTAVNAGVTLPTINVGAPDLGALERGAPIPQYGPRN